MGSIGCERPKGMTDREFFAGEYRSMSVLATARVGGVVYAACSKKAELCSVDDDASGVFALVMPVSYGGSQFVWKEMDESMGPYDDHCPAKILDMLTPTAHEYAVEWRARCRENLAKAERSKRVKAGAVVRFAEPLFFGKRYGTHDTFVFEGPRSQFRMLGGASDGLRVSLGSWRTLDFEVS